MVSTTVIVKVSAAVSQCGSAPLSVTVTVTVYWTSPCSSEGVHSKAPSEVIAIPADCEAASSV